MTRERIHELADLVIDFNEKADQLDEHDIRVSLEVDGRYNSGRVWIYTGIGSAKACSYTYMFNPDCITYPDTVKNKDIYDPNYEKAEAHIRALIAIMEAGNDTR